MRHMEGGDLATYVAVIEVDQPGADTCQCSSE
jgi:hypothetical protein